MNWIRSRIKNGEKLFGTWLGLGSETVTEIIGQAGFDWLLLDQEHGLGGPVDLLSQLQALSNSAAAPIVRVPINEPVHFKFALDAGAAGIMVPWVNSPEEAKRTVLAGRYPPRGIRGLSSSVRASRYGCDFKRYFAEANDQVTTIVQVETAEAVDRIDEIAAVDGVDVLFIGPGDLSLSLGVPYQLEHERFLAACRKIVAACRAHHKAAGILLKTPEQIDRALADGFTFLAVGTDGGLLNAALDHTAAQIARHRNQ